MTNQNTINKHVESFFKKIYFNQNQPPNLLPKIVNSKSFINAHLLSGRELSDIISLKRAGIICWLNSELLKL